MYEQFNIPIEFDSYSSLKNSSITTSYLTIILLQDNSRYQFVRDIHPDQRSGKHANHCFVVANKASMHESISLGKYFKELLQNKKQPMQSICIG